ncbi:geraniol 8-hydroxylase [Cryptomeria japonica]|uniref:geraniol 8-hydroxylase n=1 Tax=Cryptomeria japonica TaxID=3369 RepID=UPI0025ACA839|nr:geraniol 8-hydroxylase [Cryptomeria japonica]
MAGQYGPLMTISLGMKTTVVISSSGMAKEFFKIHDQIFAGRVVLEAATALSHHKLSIVFSQYGSYWRKIRRIATTQFFSPNRLQALQHLRRGQMFQSIRFVFENREKCLNVSHLVSYLGLNMLSNTIFSKSLFDPSNPDSENFRDALRKTIETVGTPNLVDFFPCLRLLDPQSLKRKTAIHLRRVSKYLDSCINDRQTARSEGICSEKDTEKDFLDFLLDSSGDDLTLMDIRTVIFELFSAGSDTYGAAIEWAMAELINNPHVMKRAQEELKQVVGANRRVEESDLDQLPHLRAVVNKVLRLHPPLPFTIPHRADSSCEVAGYSIPKHTQVIANIWAIARDPANWKEHSKFMPERFFKW